MRELNLARSSNVAAAAYDEATRTLTVTFHSGKSYTYPGIDPGTADGLEASPSPGSFVYRHMGNRPFDKLRIIDENQGFRPEIPPAAL